MVATSSMPVSLFFLFLFFYSSSFFSQDNYNSWSNEHFAITSVHFRDLLSLFEQVEDRSQFCGEKNRSLEGPHSDRPQGLSTPPHLAVRHSPDRGSALRSSPSPQASGALEPLPSVHSPIVGCERPPRALRHISGGRLCAASVAAALRLGAASAASIAAGVCWRRGQHAQSPRVRSHAVCGAPTGTRSPGGALSLRDRLADVLVFPGGRHRAAASVHPPIAARFLALVTFHHHGSVAALFFDLFLSALSSRPSASSSSLFSPLLLLLLLSSLNLFFFLFFFFFFF